MNSVYDVVMKHSDYYKLLRKMGKKGVGRVTFADMNIKNGSFVKCTITNDVCVVIDAERDLVSASGKPEDAVTLNQYCREHYITVDGPGKVFPRKVFTFNGQTIRNMQKVYALFH